MATFNVKPEELARLLSRMPERARDLSPVTNKFREVMRSRVARHFAAESSAPNGEAWAALQDSTAERKISKAKGARRRGYHPILTASGKLRKSILSEGRRAGIAVGTNVEYGEYIQRGTRRMPARPFLVFQDADIRAVTRAVWAHLWGGKASG